MQFIGDSASMKKHKHEIQLPYLVWDVNVKSIQGFGFSSTWVGSFIICESPTVIWDIQN